MAKVMEMPKLSDTMKEGGIARWLANEGDKVQTGVPVVEIETDKATMEYESPASGVLLKILVPGGNTAALNAPIAIIGKAGEDWSETLKQYEEKKAAPKSGDSKAPSAKNAASAPAAVATSAEASGSVESAASVSSGRQKASPLARRVARAKGIDLSRVAGTGPNGRVVLRDLEKAAPAAASFATSPAAAPAVAAGPDSVRVPVSMMRKTIAARLTQSVQEAPQFHLTMSVNMGKVLEWRKQAVSALAEAERFSVNDVLVFLVSRALLRHPEINASWGGDHILQHKIVHMGIAVALPNGLVTPVVRNAHAMSVPAIAARSRELVRLAREGKLQNEDFSGGTFSISNLGMFGIDEFTAILNPPQAGILAVGAATPTPVVRPDGSVGVEQRMRITMGCDHRVIDGATGAQFLKTLKSLIEDPLSALFL